MYSGHRIAIVHDWLVRPGGAEKVLDSLLDISPEADLYVLFHIPGSVSPKVESRIKGTTFIQNLPFLKQRYQYYLPLFPLAIESLRLENYDLVISSSYCVAKGIRVRNVIKHLCYCHTPMRYIWHQKEYYLKSLSQVIKIFFKINSTWLRRWDVKSSMRPDVMLTNSNSVANRIKKYYGREAQVVYPPVDLNFFFPKNDKRGNYYLAVGALVPYKGFDIAIEACEKMGRALLIAGDGPEMNKLRKKAGPWVKFLGWQSPENIRELYRTCRAMIVPGEEDFGLAMIEAQACGCPVIAINKGGAREIVIPDETGVFFDRASADSLKYAIEKFEDMIFNSRKIRLSVYRFSEELFRKKITEILNILLGE